jgi:hypothetical protein
MQPREDAEPATEKSAEMPTLPADHGRRRRRHARPWCVDSGAHIATMSTFELRLAVASGDVGAAVRVWREGMECWTPVAELPELGHAVPGLGQWVEPGLTPSPLSARAAERGCEHGASEQASASRDALPTEPTPTCSPVDLPAAVMAPVRVEPAAAAAPREPFELTATPTLAATPDEPRTQAMVVAVRVPPVRPPDGPRASSSSEPLSTPEPSAASLPALGVSVAPGARVPRAGGRFAVAAAALCALGVVVTAVRGMASAPAAAEPAAIARLAPSLLSSVRMAARASTPAPGLPAEDLAAGDPASPRAGGDGRAAPTSRPAPPRPRDPGQKRMRRSSAR